MNDKSQHEQFLRLFLEVQPRIYSYIRTMIYNRADAEDVLQNIAAVLWKKFDEFEIGTRFDQWACSIAYHQIRAHFLKKQRDRLVFSEDVLTLIAEKAVVESAAIGQFQDGLQHCLDRLPDQDREMVRLRFEPQATNRTVATALGRSETAVSRALHRVYGLLLRCIERSVDSSEQGGSV
jgi:RNA polymerase sigma-70 factor (ECF subfamily)